MPMTPRTVLTTRRADLGDIEAAFREQAFRPGQGALVVDVDPETVADVHDPGLAVLDQDAQPARQAGVAALLARFEGPEKGRCGQKEARVEGVIGLQPL